MNDDFFYIIYMLKLHDNFASDTSFAKIYNSIGGVFYCNTKLVKKHLSFRC